MMQYWKFRFLPLITRYAAAAATVAAVALLLRPFREGLGIQIIVLIYMLPVILSTMVWGLLPGVLASFIAFLAFNYFFVPPYYTLMVHKPEDLITLIMFLGVSVGVSQLIGQARAGMATARSREWEATRMYEFISAIAGLQDRRVIAHTIAQHTQETFRLQQVEVCIRGQSPETAITTRIPEGESLERKPDQSMSLMTARAQEGEIRLWQKGEPLSSEEQRLLEAFASQGALAIERTRLSQSDNRAKVLEESDRMKTSLLSSVSHELRSPLAAIKASVSSLRSGAVDWDTEARHDLLSTIEEETDHLNLLVGNLLDMSRIEAGALNPQKRWCSISEIASGVATKMRKVLKDHQLVLDFAENLPPVPADYVMIGQVFTNLISNSVKYAPPGSTITITAQKDADALHMQVVNQGPPVAEEHLSRIFDKFYRVTAADKVTGTGLGLSICKGIIENHGGKIWAVNGKGCFAFHFTLPVTLDGALPQIPEDF